MDSNEISMHIAAGRYYGRKSACGNKIKYFEESAIKTAIKLNTTGKARHSLEAYPCYWCSNWHVGRKMSQEERELFLSGAGLWLLEAETVTISASGPLFGEQLGESTLNVHNRKLCEGQFCCIHNPSNHQMVTWPLNWRADKGTMERVCPHGVGVTDPDDYAYRLSRDGENVTPAIDGSCSKCPTDLWRINE